jgi:hypothetical protein
VRPPPGLRSGKAEIRLSRRSSIARPPRPDAEEPRKRTMSRGNEKANCSTTLTADTFGVRPTGSARRISVG